jgi:hypothetical protein
LAGATIDHLVSTIIFLAAILLFIGFFNQTIQTAVIYQQHRAVATKCSDLLDTMLLTPNDATIRTWTAFGLQDPESTQYVLSPFSLMRLDSSTGTPVYLQSKDNPNVVMAYSNMTVGFGNSLLVPMSDVVNYSSALKMLGINNTYGFQLTLTPVVTVSIAEISKDPLSLALSVSGISFPLANATVSYRLIPVSLNGAYPDYLTIPNQAGTTYTGPDGTAPPVVFPTFKPNETLTYAFMAYAHVGGVAGVGFYAPSSGSQRVIPFVDALSTQKIILAHSYDVPNTAGSADTLVYNATFFSLNEDSEFQEMKLADSTGNVTSGAGRPFSTVTISNSSYNPGVLVVAYGSGVAGGVAVMPWGIGSLAFPVTFGGNSAGQEWVATDVRQVLVSGVTYQAKLSLWSYEGTQVTG